MNLQEIKQAFIDLIRIPSITGSAGEELACAYLEEILDGYGIPHERVCRIPERPNLIACIRAENPIMEPMVLISHIDVVAGDESKWSHGVFSGDVAGSAAMQFKYLALVNALFCEVNPIPVKAAMAAMGFCENFVRLPLTQMEEEHQEKLLSLMREQGLIK